MTKKEIYDCNLCEQSWEAQDVFGVDNVQDSEVVLVDPDESEKHICRSCILAIKNFGKDS